MFLSFRTPRTLLTYSFEGFLSSFVLIPDLYGAVFILLLSSHSKNIFVSCLIYFLYLFPYYINSPGFIGFFLFKWCIFHYDFIIFPVNTHVYGCKFTSVHKLCKRILFYFVDKNKMTWLLQRVKASWIRTTFPRWYFSTFSRVTDCKKSARRELSQFPEKELLFSLSCVHDFLGCWPRDFSAVNTLEAPCKLNTWGTEAWFGFVLKIRPHYADQHPRQHKRLSCWLKLRVLARVSRRSVHQFTFHLWNYLHI